MRSTNVSIRLLFLPIALFIAGAAVYAQKQNPPRQESADDDVVRVNTTLVTVPVSVMDRQGRFIPDLNQKQFRLFENGVEQEIAYFDNAEQPFTVALLLDTSDSTKFKLNDIQNAAMAFVAQLRANDRVILAVFDSRVTILSEATSDRRLLNEAIRRVQSGGGTSLYNTVDVISERLSRVRGRKAVVLFTDGVDTTSVGANYQSTLRVAEQLDALVYAIQYNTFDDANKGAKPPLSMNQSSVQMVTAKGEPLSVAYTRANRYLGLMAEKTGGRLFYSDTLKHLTEVFTNIAQELRQQYSIGYYPNSQGPEQRQIKVRVSMPQVAIRARKGYVFRPAAGNSGKK